MFIFLNYTYLNGHLSGVSVKKHRDSSDMHISFFWVKMEPFIINIDIKHSKRNHHSVIIFQ